MHALARVCRTALAVDLFAKESVRRGQKPMPGTDVSSLFEDAKTREELSEVSSGGLFREELVACLVESCFQLSQPLPEASTSGNRVLGSLSLATSQEAMGWTHAALGVVEVCRPCVKWDCKGRTYAMVRFWLSNLDCVMDWLFGSLMTLPEVSHLPLVRNRGCCRKAA